MNVFTASLEKLPSSGMKSCVAQQKSTNILVECQWTSTSLYGMMFQKAVLLCGATIASTEQTCLLFHLQCFFAFDIWKPGCTCIFWDDQALCVSLWKPSSLPIQNRYYTNVEVCCCCCCCILVVCWIPNYIINALYSYLFYQQFAAKSWTKMFFLNLLVQIWVCKLCSSIY
jgi:hypothetical protein